MDSKDTGMFRCAGLRAFAAGTALAAGPGTRAHAPIVAAAMASGEIAGRNEADVVEANAVGREVAARLERAPALDPPWDAVAVIAGLAAASSFDEAALCEDLGRRWLSAAATR